MLDNSFNELMAEKESFYFISSLIFNINFPKQICEFFKLVQIFEIP